MTEKASNILSFQACPPPINSQASALARKSKEELGYTPLKEFEESVSFKRFLVNKLGINPFTNESVERYKAYMEKKYNAGRLFWYYISNTVFNLCPVMLFFLVLPLLGKGSFLIAFLVAAACIVAMYFLFDSDIRYKYRWQEFGLHEYEDYIPPEVLQKAVQIREKYGRKVSFMVDDLVKHKISIDPFLKVKLNGVDYYIAVWQEPEFFSACYEPQSQYEKKALESAT